MKGKTSVDEEVLNQLLSDDERQIGHSQMNELLLLVNKDRMERSFFEYFFAGNCSVGSLKDGVLKFQKMAMLCYGNFIYAYRVLSRSESVPALEKMLGEWARKPNELRKCFERRSPKLVDIEQIPRESTSLVGYISAGEVIAEEERCKILLKDLPNQEVLKRMAWKDYEKAVFSAAGPEEHPSLKSIIDNYRRRVPTATVNQFVQYLKDVSHILRQNASNLDSVRKTATQNQDIYLTWDHLDVYFATSMRKRWEYEDLFDFVNSLMADSALSGLNLRHFDPTQAFTKDRVDKGLVESLMLKRAKCTVYSVQDTDTLGKDSELAATLAQGKPVIAYVPIVNVEQRLAQLIKEDPATIQDRLRFVLYADDYFSQIVTGPEYEFVRSFQALEEFGRHRIWRTVQDPEAMGELHASHGADIERLCRLIASSEARIYDRRAKTLKTTHPLGIQVNLATGVANGVLVVRTIPECAELLRRVVTNELEFEVKYDDTRWYLEEKISRCVYRVVSKDRKLTNCFWNFYRRPQD